MFKKEKKTIHFFKVQDVLRKIRGPWTEAVSEYSRCGQMNINLTDHINVREQLKDVHDNYFCTSNQNSFNKKLKECRDDYSSCKSKETRWMTLAKIRHAQVSHTSH